MRGRPRLANPSRRITVRLRHETWMKLDSIRKFYALPDISWAVAAAIRMAHKEMEERRLVETFQADPSHFAPIRIEQTQEDETCKPTQTITSTPASGKEPSASLSVTAKRSPSKKPANTGTSKPVSTNGAITVRRPSSSRLQSSSANSAGKSRKDSTASSKMSKSANGGRAGGSTVMTHSGSSKPTKGRKKTSRK